jgi:hypothetical protein
MALEEILNDLKNSIKFKEQTSTGDIVLIGMNPGLLYGSVLETKPNIKKDWWDVHFKLLVIPPIDITWILRTPQMNGEIFTINGDEQFFIAIDIAAPEQATNNPAGRRTLSIVKKDGEDGR